MKKHLSTVILLIVLLVGISVLLYPTVSNYVNNKHQSRAIANYSQVLKDVKSGDINSYFDEAEDYNKRLAESKSGFYNPETVSGYNSALNINDSGIMGYLTIEKIDVELPVYHGTDEDILQVAVGHLEGSSLPVGGESTHSVLSAHCGLPGAKLFTQLDRLEVGDTFVITVLNRKITYEVDNIQVVLPNETEALQIVKGYDYCTLMTCTPYGINSHRLLVRGVRIENSSNRQRIYVSNDAYRVDKLIIAPLMCLPPVAVLLFYLIIDDIRRTLKKKREVKAENEKNG